jgi:ANTAR domain-containing protein
VIGQAKGILMERFTVDAEAAFQMLVKSSQETNLKLTTVAQWLTTSSGSGTGPDDGQGHHSSKASVTLSPRAGPDPIGS